jgi:protein-S-isoprenylcysteine O-methyltransferase
MSLAILVSALLANGLKNAKDGDFEYIKDDNTLKVFRLVMPISVISALLVGLFEPWHWFFGEIPEYTFDETWNLLGFTLFIAGLTLRWVAILSLKKAFTVKVTILKGHKLKSNGVYRWMRHPSYTGMYIYTFGLGLALHSVLSVAILLWGVWYTTHNRIPVEEAVLEDHFGQEYRDYKAKTWKLFPLIY